MADVSWEEEEEEEEKHEPHKKHRFDDDIDNPQEEDEEQKWNLKIQVDDEFLASDVYDSENEDDAPSDEKKLSMGRRVYGPDDRFSDSDSVDEMTPEECLSYQQQVDESEGFEVGYFSQNKTWCGLILPLPSFHKDPSVVDEVNRVSQLAIHKYNTDNNTKYEFVKVIKVNTRCVSGSVYYVTFEAKDSPAAADDGGQVKTDIFQTRAYVPIKEEIEVELCRLKPIS